MIEYIIGALLVALIVLGGLLFLATHIAVKKFIDIDNRVPERKHHLWVWRIFLVALVSYSIFLIYANMEYLKSIFPGSLIMLPAIILTVYFVAFAEIIVMDFFFPDKILVWERMVIEAVIFVALCAGAYFLFNGGMALVSSAQ